MSLAKKISLGFRLANKILFRKRIPFFVGWALTNRCALKCLYCDASNLDPFEMPTKQVLNIIDELSQLGTRFIQFTGGDCILRDDIAKILEYCYQKNIYTTLSCSGILVPEKIKELRFLGRLGLSLDGRKEVQDYLRGKGTFEMVMKAIDSLKDNNIKFKFVTVLSKFNLGEIDFLLDLAKKLNSSTLFQPGIRKKLYSDEINETSPDIEPYREAVKKIISLKKQGEKVTNSFSALKHLLHWPYPKKILCPGGKIMCCIRSNGQVAVCSRVDDTHFLSNNCLEKGFREAFIDLPSYSCNNCWASLHVETSCILSFKPEAIFNSFRII